MAKHKRNPARSLEIVVSAPIETCVAALNGLHEDGYVLREKVRVDTQPVRPDLYQFMVKLSVVRGRELMDTTLRGTLRYDDNFDTTTIIGEVSPIHRQLFFKVLVATVPFVFITVNLVPLSVALVLMICVMAMLYITIQSEYDNDRTDTQRVISTTEHVLQHSSNLEWNALQ